MQTHNKEIGNLSVNEVIQLYKEQDNKEIVDLLAPRFQKILIDANADNWTEPSKECVAIGIEFAKGFYDWVDEHRYQIEVSEERIFTTNELIQEYINHLNQTV